MALLLTILTKIIINALNLHVEALHNFFKFLILFPIEYFFYLINTLIKLLLTVSNDDDVQRLVVLKDIFSLLIGSSSSHSNLTTRPLFNQFLSSTARADDLTYVIGFGIINCILGKVDLFELL